MVVAAASALLWVTSEVWAVGYRSRGMVYVGITNGMCGITEKHSGWSVQDFQTGWVAKRARGPQRLWIDTYSGGRDWWVWVPLWMPLAGSLAITAAAWILGNRAARHARSGLCPACGYNRAGLAPDAKCPECGTGAS